MFRRKGGEEAWRNEKPAQLSGSTPVKGGSIARDSGGDVFVHFTGIRGERRDMLKEGQRVKFMVVKTQRGLQAKDVVVLD